MTALEDRVAALEEALANPPMFISGGAEINGEQAARIKDQLREAFGDDFDRYGVKVLPPGRPALTPETARELLRECVTVVRPGEALAVRCPDSWPDERIYEIGRYADSVLAALGIRVVFIPGEEFAVVQPDPDDRDFKAKLIRHLPGAAGRLAKLTGSRPPREGGIPDASRSR